MSTKTTNLSLEKPAAGDKFSITGSTGYNDNMDKIDAAIGQLNSDFAKTDNKLIYKSPNAFGVNQTIRMTEISDCKDYDIITINAFRYACGGSISIVKKEIINSNYANGFIIFAQNPEKYWQFKMNATFDLTLISCNADGNPYVSIVRN